MTLDDPDPWFWGYSWSEMNGDVLIEVHTDHLKVDGFIAHHSVIFTNTTTSTVIGTITIERLNIEQYTDRTAPTINHPADVEFIVGSTGHNITWMPTDENPTTYDIMVNGTVVDSDTWTSGSAITLSLDSFAEGVYNCTITVYDVGGNFVRDSVLVTVTTETTSGGGITDLLLDNILIIGIAVGVVVVIGAIVLIRKR